MGIGTIWTDLGLQDSLNIPCPYTGPKATAEFNAISGCNAIPIEQTGADVTRCKHWSESCFETELMTGELDFGVNPLSRMTIGNLDDMGYQVSYETADQFTVADLNAADPECVCNRRLVVELDDLLDKSGGDRRRQRRRLEPKDPLSEENYQYALEAGYKLLEEAPKWEERAFGNARYIGNKIVSIIMIQNDRLYGVMVTKPE